MRRRGSPPRPRSRPARSPAWIEVSDAIARMPCASSASVERARAGAAGAVGSPRPVCPARRPVQKQSPPIAGASAARTTHSAATAATAASTALPPARKRVDRGQRRQADARSPPLPSQAMTGERPGEGESRDSRGWLHGDGGYAIRWFHRDGATGAAPSCAHRRRDRSHGLRSSLAPARGSPESRRACSSAALARAPAPPPTLRRCPSGCVRLPSCLALRICRPPIHAAGGLEVDMVRAAQFARILVLDIGRLLQRIGRAAHAATRRRRFSFRNGHGRNSGLACLGTNSAAGRSVNPGSRAYRGSPRKASTADRGSRPIRCRA